MESTQESRLSGLSLVAGVLLVGIGTFFLPRGTGSRIDYVRLVTFRAENAELTHSMSLLTILGVLLWVAGLVTLSRSVVAGHSTTDAMVRISIAILVISAVMHLAVTGIQHMIVHFINHGVGEGIGADQTDGLTAMAVTLQGVRAGLFMIKELCETVGFLVLGLAIWRRVPAGLPKMAAAAVVVASVAEVVALVIIEHVHDLTDNVLPILVVGGGVTSIWQVLIGVGLWRGSHKMIAA